MTNKILAKRIYAIVIAGIIGFTSLFSLTGTAYAAEPAVADLTVQEEEAEQYLLVSVSGLDEATAVQKITAYSGETPNLPSTLTAVDEIGSTVMIPVKWESDKAFNNKKAGTYTYSAAVEGEYVLAEDVQLPQITVKVVKCSTKITGIAMNPVKKSRSTASDVVTVENGYGRILKIQMYTGGKWVTKKSCKLKNTGTEKIKLVYPKAWWKVASSKWRFRIEKNDGAYGFTSKTIKFTTKRYYQNPSKYVQIKNDIPKHESGGYVLKPGYFGLKVMRVNRYFGIGNSNHPVYTSTTKAKVKAFQKKKGLKATGYVNKKTWLAMGLGESRWYDARISATDVNQSSTKKEHIEAMITRAKEYLGTKYVYGAAGFPKEGIDCSGLVIQCLYAAGVDPYPICSATHAYPENQYNSRKLSNYKGFKDVPYSQKKRGDLIFYDGVSGKVCHVAIYLGNGKVIESFPNKVIIADIKASFHTRVSKVRRVFN